jgi:hypothetical protein
MKLLRLPNVVLLLALFAQVIAYPFLAKWAYGHTAIVLVDWAILVAALRAARASGSEMLWGYALLVAAIVLQALAALSDNAAAHGASLLTQAAFHGYVVFCLLRYVLRDDIMTLDELFAAASMYALLAFAFSYVYAFIEFVVPGAFVINSANNADGVISWWELLYFSFTCITSVGFGEITPVSDHARSAVMVEEMLGVLYLAILISRLISIGRRARLGGGGEKQ